MNSDTVPSGSVMAESPAAGTSVDKGSTVTLTISLGKPQVMIPDESGKDPATAGADLRGLNLQVTQSMEPSNSEPSGKVTRTSPAANSNVAAGSTVTIFVSSGPQQVSVPDERGQPQAAAQTALQQAGFTVSVGMQSTGNPANSGIVLQQNPNSGTAPKGSTVTIVVGQFSGTATTSGGATTTLPG